ncbi:MAG: UDP-N-acetylglucosamine 1-carboxyvinyltransferase [Clostridia bacterium]|nr:UDP-N-acetylglucosamine 1-carboxyvinyltransferase [Clostridia bacterium]
MSFLVTGGSPLCGSVALHGAKNAALPILFASLLCHEPLLLRHVPDIGDVTVTLRLLGELGCVVTSTAEGLSLDPRGAKAPSIPMREAEKIRASSYLLGASLARFGEGVIPLPGGCALGVRPLNLHRFVFEGLGATVEEGEGQMRVTAKKLRPACIRLPFPSVGATVNFLLTAMGAEGESRLYGYAAEPHVMDTVGFLNAMGGCVTIKGECLTVVGGRPLHGGDYTVISDAMEAGTYLLAAASAGGDVTVFPLLSGELSSLTAPLSRMGFEVNEKEGSLRLRSRGASRYKATDLVAAPYPAFPSDLHPPFAALLCGGRGRGSITDTVWRERFLYTEELKKMGARITRQENRISILGAPLHGAEMWAPDLRGGAALLVAALGATGSSLIHGEQIIQRGYEKVAQTLRTLGASVWEI